jgi:flotillin
LEGHQRAILGTITVEQVYKDRRAFSEKVAEVAYPDLVNMGIMIISYTIKDIRDDVFYLKALGQSRTAQVQRDARVGEAEARMEATIAKAEAKESHMEAKLANDTEIARAQRDFNLKKAGYDVEVNTAQAEAQLAYKLKAASIQQKICEELQQVKLVERIQEIQVSVPKIIVITYRLSIISPFLGYRIIGFCSDNYR